MKQVGCVLFGGAMLSNIREQIGVLGTRFALPFEALSDILELHSRKS
jgi:hypothetical protein